MKAKTAESADSARQIAVRVIHSVRQHGQSADRIFDQQAGVARLSASDRAFALNLVMTSLRRRGSLEALMGSLLKRPLARKARYGEAVLLTGLAQILLLRTTDYSAVDESVKCTRAEPQTRHLAGLVNAVLRRAVREREALAAKLAADPLNDLPGWISARWQHHFGAAGAAALAGTLRTVPPIDIQLQPGVDPEPYHQAGGRDLPQGGVRFDSVRPEALTGYAEGAFWVQDAAAALPARYLAAGPEDHVLDLCAAPGGKTLQLAATGARVTAVDRSRARLERLHENLNRTGLSAAVIAADALDWVPEQAFSHILVDAPCSATGTYRRNPDVLWSKTERDIETLARIQTTLLQRALDWLVPGGRLIYCVCSLEPEEGLNQIKSCLARDTGVRRLAFTAQDAPYPQALSTEGDLLIRPDQAAADPSLSGGMDGFFIARLTRRASG